MFFIIFFCYFFLKIFLYNIIEILWYYQKRISRWEIISRHWQSVPRFRVTSTYHSKEMNLVEVDLSELLLAKGWTPRGKAGTAPDTDAPCLVIFVSRFICVSFAGRPSWFQEAAWGQTTGRREQFAERPPVHRQWASVVGYFGLRR